MRNIAQRVCCGMIRGLFSKDRHRFDMCRLKVREQLVQVWNVEPATGKVGTLTRKIKGLNTEHATAGRGAATRGNSRSRARKWDGRSSQMNRKDPASRGGSEWTTSKGRTEWRTQNYKKKKRLVVRQMTQGAKKLRTRKSPS